MHSNNRSLTFVHGSDDFLVDRRARVIYESAGGGEIFPLDGTNNLAESIGCVISSLETVPMFGGDGALWLRSVRFLGEVAASESDRCAMGNFLASVASASSHRRIVISAAPVDRRTKIFRDLLQISDAIDLDNGQRGDAFERTIGMLAEENGVGIDAGAANLLSMKCGDNFRLISQEIEKISTNIFGERSRISCSDVESLVDDYDSGNFFDPVEKFFEGDVLSALRAVDKYFFYNGDARPLLAAFQSRNRLLIQLQSLMKMGRIRIVGGSIARDDLSRVARALHMDTVGKSTFNVFSQNPWYLSKLARPCVLFKLQDLLKFQALFASIFLLISERNGEQKSVLRGMVVSGLTRIARRNFTQAHSYPA